MPDCENLPGCPFFNDFMANMPAAAELIKLRFCKNDNATCARYIVSKALGKTNVPVDLFPSQSERAQELLAHRK